MNFIAIIDYGMGNLRSVKKSFEKAGWSVSVVSDKQQVEKARGVVLPGVGAFADAMSNLKRAGLDEVILQAIADGKPFLGICLGMQLLFEASEEWKYTRGLGVFPGIVRRLPKNENLKVPHMGWNQVLFKKECPLVTGIPDGSFFYFVHSYYVEPADMGLVTGVTEYGFSFTSMIAADNVFGIQFHPEKSSALGLQILRNFGGLVAKC